MTCRSQQHNTVFSQTCFVQYCSQYCMWLLSPWNVVSGRKNLSSTLLGSVTRVLQNKLTKDRLTGEKAQKNLFLCMCTEVYKKEVKEAVQAQGLNALLTKERGFGLQRMLNHGPWLGNTCGTIETCWCKCLGFQWWVALPFLVQGRGHFHKCVPFF